MNRHFRVKKAFTLIELMIVILIISLTYYLSLNSFKSKSIKKNKMSISTLKKDLLVNNSFKNSLRFLCINDELLSCFTLVDNDLENIRKSKSIFKTLPDIYEYNKNFTLSSFENIRIDNTTYDIFFELEFDKDRKHNNFIIEYENSFYLFKAISKDIEIYDSILQLEEKENSLKQKVQYAF